jgi:23S rRNA (pseudouridine1915-N3)-methyltransferase
VRVLVATAFENSKDPFEIGAQDYLRRAHGIFKAELRQVKPEKLLAITQGHTRILLDENGAEYDSETWAVKLRKLIDQPKPVAFLIGPPSGHEQETHAAADHIWSLSKLTMPHKMALCMLAEQIYRAGEINRGGPYHRP